MAPFPGSLLMWERGSKGQFLRYKKKSHFGQGSNWFSGLEKTVRLDTGMGRSAS